MKNPNDYTLGTLETQVEDTFRMVVIHTSGCCGAYLTDTEAEYEICCECRDHCEVISETVPVAY